MTRRYRERRRQPDFSNELSARSGHTLFPPSGRLIVTGADQVLVDLALDATPGHPPVASIAGPTLAPKELAGRKMIALFNRAAARDFADVYALSRTFDQQSLLSPAAESDPGFQPTIFAQMMNHLPRYSDADLSLGDADVPALRTFYDDWKRDLGSAGSN